MLLSSASSAIIAAVGLASGVNALAPDDPASFAFNLSPVDDLGAQPTDECFYDVTIPDLLELGFKQYAWVPWSVLTNESLAIAPHGAFVYKTVNGTLDYEKITSVNDLSDGADLIFGEATPFMPPAQTFEDITSGNVTIDDTVMLDRIKTGLNCWASPTSYTTIEPFVNYQRFAWISADANKCGEFVYELKDGGLVQHSCDGPDTNAQEVDESEEVAAEDEQVDDTETETDAAADDEEDGDELPKNEDTNPQTSTGNVLKFATLSVALAMASCIHYY